MARSRSSSRIRNWSGVSLATPILDLSLPVLYKATHVLCHLVAISELRLTTANVKSCCLNKRTAYFLNSSKLYDVVRVSCKLLTI